jgi:hypothetical protein
MAMKEIIIRPDGMKEFVADILERCREDPRRYDAQIRRLARYDGLYPKKSRRDHKWYFADATNHLRSPENGLDDVQALEWLCSE